MRLSVNLAQLQRRDAARKLFLFILCALLLLLLLTCFFQRTVVVGASMDTTLHDGQNLLMLRTAWNPLITVRHGDIVVARYQDGLIIKRVIGCPGDVLEIRNNQVYLNGVQLYEPYLNEPMHTPNISPVTLGQGAYFLMGDNRNRSADSRRMGTFSEDEIYGVIYLDHQIPLLVICICLVLAVGIMAVSLYSNDEKECVRNA